MPERSKGETPEAIAWFTRGRRYITARERIDVSPYEIGTSPTERYSKSRRR